jgi:hypothetical protein
MRQLRQLLFLLVSVTACSSAPQTRRLGDYTASQPLFITPADQKTPRQITVNLQAPSYVAALYVVPGRGAVVVYPNDSTTDTHVDAGQHVVPMYFSERPFNRDSMIAAIRRETQGGTRVVRPSTDSARARGDSARLGLRDPGPGASPIGYLLLVASPSRIPYATLVHRVNGITIPIEDDEALSTVMKLVKAALPEGAPLAGYARELDRS